ncbi:hypothetical protein TUBRATIS_17470 [Tubulinosema ratisbonensis]|uniref:Uncharacterized protein n=1 Tax=Tubulinosema ratisbonensis TaxID=291195 RepID=A0A437AKR9_9MICR|nr:hypothetical protein TUBRATIS_17470 [Tubulinosema ratisbonensis]
MKKETYASSRRRLLYLKKSSLIRKFIFSSRIFIYLNCCFLLDFDENSMFIANLLLKTFLNFVDIKNQLYLKLFVFDDFFLEKFKLSESQFNDASFETNKMFYGENEIDFFDVPLLESLPNKWIKHKSENINQFLLEIILENKPDFFDKEKSKYLVYLKEREILFNLEKYMSDQQLSFTQEFNQQII